MADEFPVLRIRAHGPSGAQVDEITLDGKPLYALSIDLSVSWDGLTTATIKIEVTPDIDLPGCVTLAPAGPAAVAVDG